MTGLGSSCGACKFLRRKCSNECVFAPHFCYDEAAAHFAAVHKVFGASNVSKLLLHLPLHHRNDAASTISFEALARMRDPIYGCVAHIFALQQQVGYLQEEIEVLGNQIASSFAFGVESCGSNSEATNNSYSNSNNIYLDDLLLPQQSVIYPQSQHSNPHEHIIAQPQNSNGTSGDTNTFSGLADLFDVHVGPVQFQTMCGLGEESVFCHSLSEPLELEGLFEGIDQWLDDNPIVGPTWD